LNYVTLLVLQRLKDNKPRGSGLTGGFLAKGYKLGERTDSREAESWKLIYFRKESGRQLGAAEYFNSFEEGYSYFNYLKAEYPHKEKPLFYFYASGNKEEEEERQEKRKKLLNKEKYK